MINESRTSGAQLYPSFWGLDIFDKFCIMKLTIQFGLKSYQIARY